MTSQECDILTLWIKVDRIHKFIRKRSRIRKFRGKGLFRQDDNEIKFN